jgi:SAM-dependent MidA family methyltransferase
VSEVTTATAPFVEAISRVGGQGCLLVFDYGYHQVDIAAGRFFQGSMLGYKEWGIREDIFSSLGEMDITHHVNFDHLSALLEKGGWRKEGEIEQYRFLCNAGVLQGLCELPGDERLSAKWLVSPDGLGSMISVLGFSRGLSLPLHGFGRAR